MQEKQLFEYAVIRVVPRVDREEFLNIGVVLYCAKPRFLKVLYKLDAARLEAAFPGKLDMAGLEAYLCAFERICMGGKQGGTIGMLPAAERFRWLTATRSTILQTSKVHPGFCGEPDVALVRLYEQLVL
ncbi:DUF3037 domain-containing protein [Deminuibacter soli]|uniref:DUF3037 domain-containing protein n=1 Tax=Deminuibacter soli TaxID=2291815 RepID=A0A3E1NCQ7_9BACT|nr:DUF3037 domain-containing protein [Deminuibacter soli]RFM25642.1 DUF3037 domain-containing protein [Deminuibacter soli]